MRAASRSTPCQRPCIPDRPIGAPGGELLGRSFQHQRHRSPVLELRRVHPRALSTIPSVSTSKCRFLALSFFAPSYPRRPPTLVVFTDWVSTIPALGWGSRPALVRILSRSTPLIFSQVPSLCATS